LASTAIGEVPASTEENGNGGQKTTRRQEKSWITLPTKQATEFAWSSPCFSEVWESRYQMLFGCRAKLE